MIEKSGRNTERLWRSGTMVCDGRSVCFCFGNCTIRTNLPLPNKVFVIARSGYGFGGESVFHWRTPRLFVYILQWISMHTNR